MVAGNSIWNLYIIHMVCVCVGVQLPFVQQGKSVAAATTFLAGLHQGQCLVIAVERGSPAATVVTRKQLLSFSSHYVIEIA